MNFLHAILLVSTIFAFPEPRVNWVSPDHDRVKVEVESKGEFISQCLEGGLEVRYRYETKLCRRRTLWADSCADPKVEIRSLQFDPISEGYRLSIDWLGDKVPAKVVHISGEDQALRTLGTIPAIIFDEIGYSIEKYPSDSKPYIGIRVIADCKGDYNETLAKISSWLTLGLLDLATFDSGWVDFRIGS